MRTHRMPPENLPRKKGKHSTGLVSSDDEAPVKGRMGKATRGVKKKDIKKPKGVPKRKGLRRTPVKEAGSPGKLGRPSITAWGYAQRELAEFEDETKDELFYGTWAQAKMKHLRRYIQTAKDELQKLPLGKARREQN